MKKMTIRKTTKYILIILASLIIITIFLPSKSVFAAETNGITDGKVYNLTNKASGKCLNVNLGTDADGTNVIQWTKDQSKEQKFRVIYIDKRGTATIESYKLCAMCSSNGTNRVLDIYKNNGVKSGCNVDIWAPNDYDAQDWKVIDRGSGYYSLHPRVNTSLALTSYGTANGSGAGTGTTSAGNVYITTWSSTNNNQLWRFDEIIGSPACIYRHANGTLNESYYVDGSVNNFLSTASSRLIDAAAASWSSIISLTRKTSLAGTDLNFYGENTAYFGVNGSKTVATTTFHNSSGGGINPDVSIWAFAHISVNVDVFPNYTDFNRQGSMAHELGHAFGLKENNTKPNSIMCQLSSR